MQNIRIIKVPPLKVVSSGAITNMEELEAFDRWWSAIDMSHYITPRDFMWYNEKEKYMEWVVAVPDNISDFSDYQLVDFPGGLYAVAASKNTDEGRPAHHGRKVLRRRCALLGSRLQDG
jgi:DNA gyrase inhibitor GyrI